MLRYKRLSYTMLLSVLLAVVFSTGCVDDDLVFRQSVTPHGEAVVNIEAAFEPFTEKTMGSRAYYDAPAGDGMKDVSDVVLLAYDVNGNLLDGFPMELTDYAEKDENRTGADTSDGGSTTETTTKCLTKTIKLFFGDYYLIAVANMGEYSDGGDGKINVDKTTMEAFNEMAEDKYNTLDALRKLRREWKTDNFRNNREMCGYFVDKAKNSSNPNATSDFEAVHVDRDGMTLRTWMRRLASKVTVDFDGTGLRENVKVFIKDVKIYDLALSCTLGFGKHNPGADEHYISYNNAIGSNDDAAKGTHAAMLREGSHVINFYNRYKNAASANDDGHKDWPMISKGSPYIYVDPAADTKVKADLHANNASSLFFYENMQGDAPYGKGPLVDLVHGGVANKDSIKESVPYGTYIEVTAYYESEASNNISNGPIKYRFMLGKDAVRNCDAERNYHYKVTLKLNGNANEFSWHIDYKEEPDTWDVPQPWYVSYLYNHQSTIPFKYTPPEGYEVVYFEAEITDNPWQPDEDTGIPLPPDNSDALSGNNKSIGNGFLSLRKTIEPVITPEMCQSGLPEWKVDYKNDNMKQLNLDYFTGAETVPEKYRLDRSKRTFYVDGRNDPENTGDEKYSYQRRDNSVSLNMPLYTRAKLLIKQTGYSGNNPYVGYTRTATVRVTPYMRKINTQDTPAKMEGKYKDIKVEQVRRIVNPKGVYRRSGNNQDFNVHLLELPGDMAPTFRDFKSDGPWMAEILGDKNFITLDGKQTVTGSTGSSIIFNIRFNKLNTDNTVRNAVVRVRYNSYTCTHLIFVRQGYDSQAITDKAKDFNNQGGNGTAVKWRTFNRLSKTKDVDDPRDEGSLFKYGNITQPIHPFNNCYKDKDANGNYDGIGDYRAPVSSANNDPYLTSFYQNDDYASAGEYYLTNDNGTKAGSRTAWGTISKDGNGFPDTDGWDKMATMRHFEQLYASANMQFGFGVLYADGATTTQFAVNDAYGYFRDDPNKAIKGMRGIFIYYWDEYNPQSSYTGKNIFFPIGRSGYGHRKEGYQSWDKSWTEYPNGRGVLRYSCSGYKSRSSTFQNSAPLFSALYYRPGAIYYAKKSFAEQQYLDWTGKPASDGEACGMDLNYFTFDVNMIGKGNLSGGEDGCFVRFIE